MLGEIPAELLHNALMVAERVHSPLPFKHRGVRISEQLIQATMEILNAEPSKTLPQNCRQLKLGDSIDGLDRRLKVKLGTDLRRANIISAVLEEAGVVEVLAVTNPISGREVKGTRLLENWTW